MNPTKVARRVSAFRFFLFPVSRLSSEIGSSPREEDAFYHRGSAFLLKGFLNDGLFFFFLKSLEGQSCFEK